MMIMYEKMGDMEGKEQEVAKSSAEKRGMQMLAPEVSSQAKVVIPGQCDFVWHVERAPGIVKRGGKSVSASISMVRTRGTSVITASSTGKDHLLKALEPLDIAHLLKKMGEDWKAKPPVIKKFTSKTDSPKPKTTTAKKKGKFAK
jgi:ribosomal protein L27